MNRIITLLSLLFFTVFSPSILRATTCTWTGTGDDGNFAGNWSCGSVPTDMDDVVIENTNVPIRMIGLTFKSLVLTNVSIRIAGLTILQNATINNANISTLYLDGGDYLFRTSSEFQCGGDLHFSGNCTLFALDLTTKNIFVDAGTLTHKPDYGPYPDPNSLTRIRPFYGGNVGFDRMTIATGAIFNTVKASFYESLGRTAIITNNGTVRLSRIFEVTPFVGEHGEYVEKQQFLYSADVNFINNGLLDLSDGGKITSPPDFDATLENTSTGEIRLYGTEYRPFGIQQAICGTGQINCLHSDYFNGGSHRALTFCDGASPNINISAGAGLTCSIKDLGGNITIGTGGILNVVRTLGGGQFGNLNGSITGGGNLSFVSSPYTYNIVGTLNITGELSTQGDVKIKGTANFSCPLIKVCGNLWFEGTHTLSPNTSIVKATICSSSRLMFPVGSVITINSVIPDDFDVGIGGEVTFNQGGTLTFQELALGGKVTGPTAFKVIKRFTAGNSIIEIPSLTVESNNGESWFVNDNLLNCNVINKSPYFYIGGNLSIAPSKTFTNLNKVFVNTLAVTINGNFINTANSVFEVGTRNIHSGDVMIGNVTFSANSVVTNNGTFINNPSNAIGFDCPFTNNGTIKGLESSYYFTGGFTNSTGGVVIPNIANNYGGTLTLWGSINFATGGKLKIAFNFDDRPGYANPWGCDKLIIPGSVTLGGTLEIDGTGAFDKLPTYTDIITGTAFQFGNFASVSKRSIRVDVNQTLLKTRISFGPVFSNWTGAISSDWNDVGNWDSNFVPDLYEIARVPTGTTPANYTSTNGKIWRLDMSGNTLNMAAGSKLTVQNALLFNGGTLSSEGTIELKSTALTTFSNCTLSGTIVLAGNANFVGAMGVPGMPPPALIGVNLGISGSKTMRFSSINGITPTFTIPFGTTMTVNGTTYIDKGIINNSGTVICNADFDYANGQHQDFMTYNNLGKTVLRCNYFLGYLDRFYNPPGGSIESHGANIYPSFCNQGAINLLEGQLGVRFTNACTGIILPGSSLSSAYATIANGAALLADDSYINFPVTVNSGGQITMTRSSVIGNGSINGNGLVRLFDHNYLKNGTGLSSSLEFMVFDDYPVIYLPNGFTLGITGKFRGKGSFDGGLSSVTVAGLVTPGFSPGTLTINPSVTSTSTAVYEMEITGGYGAAGTAADADKLISSGNIALDGTLKIILTNPQAGIYPLIDGITTTGNFSSVLYSMNGGSFSTTPPPGVSIAFDAAQGTVTVAVASVLPLELLTFKAQNTEGGNILTWQTASEVNTSHFDIERSNDGLNFEKIGETKAQGKAATYEFFDRGPLSITTYYRLKINDLDNKSSYSKVVSLSPKGKGLNAKIFPNPFRDNITIDVSTDHKTALTIDLTDILGRSIKHLSLNTEGSLNLPISTNDLSNGVYFIKISDGQTVIQQRIVKQ